MVCWEVKEVKVLRRSNSVAHFDHEVYPQRLSLDMALYGAHVEMGWFVIARLVDRRNCHLLGAQTACIACPPAARTELYIRSRHVPCSVVGLCTADSTAPL